MAAFRKRGRNALKPIQVIGDVLGADQVRTTMTVPFSDEITYYIVTAKAGYGRRVGLLECKANVKPPTMLKAYKGCAIVRVWEGMPKSKVTLAVSQAVALVEHIRKLGLPSAWALVHTGAAANFGVKIPIPPSARIEYGRDHA